MSQYYDPYDSPDFGTESAFDDPRPYRNARERAVYIEKVAEKTSAISDAPLIPVSTRAKSIAKTVWGKSWCRHLNHYQDYEYRLPRGRAYLRDGGVIDLQIAEGRVDAQVVGQELYQVTVCIDSLGEDEREEIVKSFSSKLDSVVELLAGKIPDSLLSKIASHEAGLFPDPEQIKFSCTCPDYADLCKHVAATLYGIAVRFDQNPRLFFDLRGLSPELLCGDVSAAISEELDINSINFDASELEEIFGIEIGV